MIPLFFIFVNFFPLLQLTVLNKGICEGQGNSRNRTHNFHFKVKENSVECFYPGTRT